MVVIGGWDGGFDLGEVRFTIFRGLRGGLVVVLVVVSGGFVNFVTDVGVIVK